MFTRKKNTLPPSVAQRMEKPVKILNPKDSNKLKEQKIMWMTKIINPEKLIVNVRPPKEKKVIDMKPEIIPPMKETKKIEKPVNNTLAEKDKIYNMTEELMEEQKKIQKIFDEYMVDIYPLMLDRFLKLKQIEVRKGKEKIDISRREFEEDFIWMVNTYLFANRSIYSDKMAPKFDTPKEVKKRKPNTFGSY